MNPAPEPQSENGPAGACATRSAIPDPPAIRTTRDSIQPAASECADAGPDCAGDRSGVFAVQFDLDVYWRDELNLSLPLIDPGRGKITVFSSAQVGDDGRVAIRTCGLRLPPLYSDLSGSVTQLFTPDGVWDGEDMPAFASDVHGDTDDTLIMDPIMQTTGLELFDSAWPTYDQTPFVKCAHGTGAACFLDQDSDGKPGITFWSLFGAAPPEAPYTRPAGWHYDALPTSAGVQYSGDGATAVYLALRTTLGSALAIGPNCASDTRPADADDVMLRALDCVMQQGPCSVGGATFVDQNLPVFHALQQGEAPPSTWKHLRTNADAELDRSPSAGPTSRSVRVGDGSRPIDCAAVRCALASNTP